MNYMHNFGKHAKSQGHKLSSNGKVIQKTVSHGTAHTGKSLMETVSGMISPYYKPAPVVVPIRNENEYEGSLIYHADRNILGL